MDTFTSMLAGTCLFMILGHLEWKDEQDASISTVNKKTVEKLAMGDGAGMAFVTFPSVLEAFGDYPGPNVGYISIFKYLFHSFTYEYI
jgi:hypothetical protein